LRSTPNKINCRWIGCRSNITYLFTFYANTRTTYLINYWFITWLYIISCTLWIYISIRRFMSVGNGKAIRSHMLMLAVAVTLFAPILEFGYSVFGSEVSGFVSPVGVNLLVGAFIFGIGMQLGGGCASGTLYAVGSGRSVMFITLLFFIIGTTIGAYHLPFWTEDLPVFEPISLATSTGLGYGGAWGLSIIIFGLVTWFTIR